jgi:LEA14-like dessication related protein
MDPGDLASTLAASKLRLFLIAVVAVAVAIAGAFAVGVLGLPSVVAIDNTFGDVTNETTTVHSDIVVSNPNPIGVDLEGVSVNYTISMNTVEMAHGGRDGIAVGSGNSTLELETRMRNDAIPPWWTSHIRNGERTDVAIDATITSGRLDRSATISQTREIETDLIGAFDSDETRPVNADSAFVDDPILYVNETRGEWGTVTETETPIDMSFVVYNPNIEPYAVTELGYEITMNDVPMGEGQTRDPHVIPSRSSETIDLTTILNNQRLDEWWVTHLDEDVHGHQVSELRIEFHAVIELPTGEAVTVPLNRLTHEEPIETDIFGEGADAGETTGSDGESTPTDGGGEASPTPTATETETERTQTETETDSGSTETPTNGGTETDDGGTLPL